ncbi:PAS domain-containing protein [Paenibacillaceae bacterium]|nr:PAS domain-containing protein [Paenibacillaceae bacterium]
MEQFAITFLKDDNSGVILLNAEFRVTEISGLACRLLGVSREQVIGQPMDVLFLEAPEVHQLLGRMVIEEELIRSQPFQWATEDDGCELLMDANLLRDEEGRLHGAYIIFKDVSNVRLLEEQVQRSDRLSMIGQIAAGTAHEIRNPLTAIKGFLQMFKVTLKEKGLQKEVGYTEIMLSEIDRINSLVSEFLLLSKPKDTAYDSVELSTVLNEIMPIVNSEALLHGIVVQYDEETLLPQVIADREMLKQVFLNICKNGIEAMKDSGCVGGVLTVKGEIQREYNGKRMVNIHIHDTGPGIPEDLIDKVFDPFVTTKQDGTGLGLSVCQRIIHEMDGEIRISSQEGNTVFTVVIACPADKASQ